MTIDTAIEPMRLVTAKGVEIDLDPLNGLWTEAQYLALSDHARTLVEYTDGDMEILEMPTPYHQRIVLFLYRLLFNLLDAQGADIFVAPLRMRVRSGAFREPDLLVLLDRDDPRGVGRFWEGADLVVEVVSNDDPTRDTVTKRADYAAASIPEYWIVNPIDTTITVLTLVGGTYHEHCVAVAGAQATSALIPGLGVDVAAVFAAR